MFPSAAVVAGTAGGAGSAEPGPVLLHAADLEGRTLSSHSCGRHGERPGARAGAAVRPPVAGRKVGWAESASPTIFRRGLRFVDQDWWDSQTRPTLPRADLEGRTAGSHSCGRHGERTGARAGARIRPPVAGSKSEGLNGICWWPCGTLINLNQARRFLHTFPLPCTQGRGPG